MSQGPSSRSPCPTSILEGNQSDYTISSRSTSGNRRSPDTKLRVSRISRRGFRLDRFAGSGHTATSRTPLPETDSWDRVAPTRVMEDETNVVCRIQFVNERSSHSPLALSGCRACSSLQFAVRRGLCSFSVIEPTASISRAFPRRNDTAVATGRWPVPIPSQLDGAGWGRCRSKRADAATWTRMLGKRPGTIDRVTGR